MTADVEDLRLQATTLRRCLRVLVAADSVRLAAGVARMVVKPTPLIISASFLLPTRYATSPTAAAVQTLSHAVAESCVKYVRDTAREITSATLKTSRIVVTSLTARASRQLQLRQTQFRTPPPSPRSPKWGGLTKQ